MDTLSPYSPEAVATDHPVPSPASDAANRSGSTDDERYRLVARRRHTDTTAPMSAADVVRAVWAGAVDADAYELVVIPAEESDDRHGC